MTAAATATIRSSHEIVLHCLEWKITLDFGLHGHEHRSPLAAASPNVSCWVESCSIVVLTRLHTFPTFSLWL